MRSCPVCGVALETGIMCSQHWGWIRGHFRHKGAHRNPDAPLDGWSPTGMPQFVTRDMLLFLYRNGRPRDGFAEALANVVAQLQERMRQSDGGRPAKGAVAPPAKGRPSVPPALSSD